MGKGSGSEAVKLLLQYGFDNLQLKRIYLHVFTNNIRAIKSYLKNKFKEEGIVNNASLINNEYVSAKLMAIYREDFYS